MTHEITLLPLAHIDDHILVRDRLALEEVHDLLGLRVITDSEATCRQALRAIRRRWAGRSFRFKDYIANPKPNGYRSIHTTVSGRDGERDEVQIRTRQVHDVAETRATVTIIEFWK